MISNNTDLYETVRDLTSELSKAGEEQWSSALKEALTISSVPGEILGETRLQLRGLQNSQTATRLGLQGQVNDALSYLDRILGH